MTKKIENIPYLTILKKALEITWKNKFLWWFGLFLALGGGANGFNFNLNHNEKSNTVYEQKMIDFITSHAAAAITIATILTIIFLILIILGIIARAGAIKSIDKVIKNQTTSFRPEMKAGKKYFWKLVGLGISIILLVLVSLIVLVTPVVFLFISKAYLLGTLLAILALIILVPIFVLAGYMKTYGQIYIVLSDMPAFAAIETAFELFAKNIWTSLIMGLLFIPIAIIVMTGMMIVIVPLGILAFVLAYIGPVGIILAVIPAIVIITVFLFVQSLLQIFHQTAWLLFFREIAAPAQEEKAEDSVEEPVAEKILPSPDTAIKTIESEK